MRFLLGSGILLLLLGAVFYGWVSTGPRSIPSLNPYIEKGLSKTLPGYHFHVASHLLRWDDHKNTLGLLIKDVAVENAQNQAIATFPQIKINLSLSYLFIGRINPTEVVIMKPAFKIALPAKAATGNYEVYTKMADALLGFSQLAPEHNQLESITVRDADILVATPNKALLLHIVSNQTLFERENTQLHIRNRLNATLESHPLQVDVDIRFPNEKEAKLMCGIHQVSSEVLNDIFPSNTLLQNIHLMFNGNITVTLPKHALPVIERFELADVSGSFTHPTYFISPVNIKSLSLVGKVDPDFSVITLDKMDADFGGATLHASGFIKQKDFSLTDIVVDAKAANVPIDDIRLYWPSGIKGEPARNWVIQRISKGVVPSAYAKLWVSEEDFKQRHLSTSSLEASVDFVGGEVRYFDAYPPATGVNGTAKFTGTSVDIAITKGAILSSAIKKAEVRIGDFRQHPAVVTIAGEASGEGADATAFFPVDRVNQILATDLQKMGGTADTKVNISIPLMHPVTLQDMVIDITSHIQNATLPHLFGKYDMSANQLQFSFNGQTLYLAGDAEANTTPVNVEVATNLPMPGSRYFDGSYTIKGTLSPRSAASLKLPEIPYFSSGSIPYELIIHEKQGTKQYDLHADLNKANIQLEHLGWEKKPGEDLRLEIIADQLADKQLQLTKIQFTSPHVSVEGTGKVASDFSAVSHLDLRGVRFNKNDFSIMLDENATSKTLTLRGKALDLSQARFGKLFTSSTENNKGKLFTLKLNLGKIFMKNDEIFSGMAGQVNCRLGICTHGQIKAGLGDAGNLSMKIQPVEGKTGLHLESNQAGHISRALNIYNNMQGGSLALDARFSKHPKSAAQEPDSNLIEGVLQIDDFRAAKTPILAKIASLASFEGITSILENKGIKFKRLRAPFRFENDVIYINDAKAYGDSLGITTKGRIDTQNDTLKLSGTFVPSYAVNNILGKIPVIGKIGDVLMGGKGQGILAVRYKVKGPYSNAEVSVNPLSILTPGFLRNLFDIVDYIQPVPQNHLGNISPAAGEVTKP